MNVSSQTKNDHFSNNGTDIHTEPFFDLSLQCEGGFKLIVLIHSLVDFEIASHIY